MKRLAWLLVLPYVVVRSSGSWYVESKSTDDPDGAWTLNVYTRHFGPFENREFTADMAEALNEAHERRCTKRRFVAATLTTVDHMETYNDCTTAQPPE